MNKYRFLYWKKIIEQSIENPKKSDIVAIIPTYNQYENVKKIIEFCIKSPIDILIIDNHSSDGTFQRLNNEFKEINMLRTIENLGGSGAFAIGQEWVIERNYDFCFFIEDDVIPLDDDILEVMINHRDSKKIVHSKYFEFNCMSYAFHFTLYPVWIFNEIGVVYKDFFLRADDWEYYGRIKKYLKDVKSICIDKYYSHPVIKKGFKVFHNYFGMRNWLIALYLYPARNRIIDISVIIIQYLWNSLFMILFDKSMVGMRMFFASLNDSLQKNFTNNSKILKMFNDEIRPSNFNIISTDMQTFLKTYRKYRLVGRLRKTIIGQDFSKSLTCFVTQKYNSPYRVIAFLGKKIIFIEEIDFINQKVDYIVYNNNIMISWPFVMISLILTVSLLPFFLIIILLGVGKKLNA